jgi:hypothetical protein
MATGSAGFVAVVVAVIAVASGGVAVVVVATGGGGAVGGAVGGAFGEPPGITNDIDRAAKSSPATSTWVTATVNLVGSGIGRISPA